MKVVNLLPSILKKSSASKPTKSKTTKKGKGIVTGTLKVDFFFFLVPYVGNLSPVGNTILESTPSPAVRSRSTRKFATVKPKPPLPRQPLDAPPSSKTRGSMKKTSPLVWSAPSERRVYYL